MFCNYIPKTLINQFLFVLLMLQRPYMNPNPYVVQARKFPSVNCFYHKSQLVFMSLICFFLHLFRGKTLEIDPEIVTSLALSRRQTKENNVIALLNFFGKYW